MADFFTAAIRAEAMSTHDQNRECNRLGWDAMQRAAAGALQGELSLP